MVILEDIADKCNVKDFDSVKKRKNIFILTTKLENVPTPELLKKVEAVLPDQPWERGIAKRIAESLNIEEKIARAAIKILNKRGKQYRYYNRIKG